MSIYRLLVATVVISGAMIALAGSEEQSTQQSAVNRGGMIGPGMMGYHGSAGIIHEGAFSAGMCTAMASHVEGRLAYLKAELKITPDQESLWNSYAAAARDSANTMLARCTVTMTQHSGSMTSLPERLDQNEQLMAAQLDAMRAMNKATALRRAWRKSTASCGSTVLGTYGHDVKSRFKT